MPLSTSRAVVCQLLERIGTEVSEKQTQVSVPVRWELIGHLQSNKASAAHFFDRIQSVDSAKLIARLDRAAEAQQKVCLFCCSAMSPAKYKGWTAGGGPTGRPGTSTGRKVLKGGWLDDDCSN